MRFWIIPFDMYIVNSRNVKPYPLKNCRGVWVRYLLHAGVGAKRIQLRLFTIEPGFSTPLERHEHEHEVYVLRGVGVLRGEEGEVEVKPGDAIFIASNELHQFVNTGEEPLEFLCTKETDKPPEVLA